jgi:hypothetical protein
MGSRLLCDALFVPQHHEPPSMHEVRASSLLGSKVVQQHPILSSKPVGRKLGSTIRSPLTSSDDDHGAVQASRIEKKRRRRMWIKAPHRSTGKQPLIGNIQHLFVQERPRVPPAIHQFTNSGCFTSQFWWGVVRQHW